MPSILFIDEMYRYIVFYCTSEVLLIQSFAGQTFPSAAPKLIRPCVVQVTWMVCRKFQFQVFNYVDQDGKGTLDPGKAQRITGATAFLVSDHLAQLIITDGMSREGCCPPPH